MNFIPDISISTYDYDLPEDRIAQFPLKVRDESKLLVCDTSHVSEDVFKNLPKLLPAGSLVIFNETRVIRARILFRKPTGAEVEIFCLEPVLPALELQEAIGQKRSVTWKCMIGNAKRWKQGILTKKFSIGGREGILGAEITGKTTGQYHIRFSWEPWDISFSELLMLAGSIPLPPYIHRRADENDAERYQTIFARQEGSVAAPTAGLHFTDRILHELKARNIVLEKVVLHVGAGTFKPVTSKTIRDHDMHPEKMIISRKTIETIAGWQGKPVVVTGTTTMRTVESLYWYGVKSMVDRTDDPNACVGQWDAYNPKYQAGITTQESLEYILGLMNRRNAGYLEGMTRLMIVPGYKFRISDVLITNFHLPQSTLLLLVSAFTGGAWRKAYEYAMAHDFRFLSYGDACLFFRQ
jgi:S-adenosylmethionine:tRNA ribosyltransferase-isomerase